MSIKNKIDFAVVFAARNANPNGDPLNGNRPRTTYESLGEVSDVCIKRKMRDRLMEKGVPIFVQSDDKKIDDCKSLRERADGVLSKMKSEKEMKETACKTWFDVRAFGQLFAFKGKAKKSDGVSMGIRGPVSVHPAFSLAPVSVTSTQITKSVSGEGDGKKKSSDTMGMKHRVDHGVYVFYGSINPQLATNTGFSDEDAEALKGILPRLFENDASSARPEGSMEVLKVIWWKHDCPHGQVPSAKVHRSMTVTEDGEVSLIDVGGPTPEVIAGF